MNKLKCCVLLSFVTLCFVVSKAQDGNQPCSTVKQIEKHVYTLASDEMKGRNTGTEGQKLAAGYIEEAFVKAGVEPAGDSGYFQPFKIYRPTPSFLKFRDNEISGSALIKVECKGCWSDSAKVIFVGDKRLNIVFDKPQEYLVLLRADKDSKRLKLIKHYIALGFNKFVFVESYQRYWGEMIQQVSKGSGWQLEGNISQTKFEKLLAVENISFGVASIPEDKLFLFGDGPAIFNVWTKIVRKNKAPIVVSDKVFVDVNRLDANVSFTENVVALLPGSDPNSDYIIVTAHYDHLGSDESQIFRGADDNASGTAALMQLAEMLAKRQKSGEFFKYHILFVAFSAEELGLLGSRYFVNSNLFPEGKAILNINMDMIGRSDKYGMIRAMIGRESKSPKYSKKKQQGVYLLNKGKSSRVGVRAGKKEAKTIEGFKLDRTPGLLTRLTYKMSSDHKSFADKGVPILVYFTGLHPDYHTARDVPEEIDYENMEKIISIIEHTIRSYSR